MYKQGKPQGGRNYNGNQGGKRYNGNTGNNGNGGGYGGGQTEQQNSGNGGYGGQQTRYNGGQGGAQQKPRYNDHYQGGSQGGRFEARDNQENYYQRNGGGYGSAAHNPEVPSEERGPYKKQGQGYGGGGRPQTGKPQFGGGAPQERKNMPLKNEYQSAAGAQGPPRKQQAPRQQAPAQATAAAPQGSNPFAQMTAPGFSKQPQASRSAAQVQAPPRTAPANSRPKAMAPARGGPQGGPGKQQQISLLSNQYKLTLGQNACVYQYCLDIKPDEFWEAHRVHDIIRTKKTALEKALGAYVVSGKTIYTLTELEETLVFKTVYKGD